MNQNYITSHPDKYLQEVLYKNKEEKFLFQNFRQLSTVCFGNERKMSSIVVEMGFAEKKEPEWLTNRYFPSKIGGKPAWLDLDLIPSAEDLACRNCSAPMTFICQVNQSNGPQTCKSVMELTQKYIASPIIRFIGFSAVLCLGLYRFMHPSPPNTISIVHCICSVAEM